MKQRLSIAAVGSIFGKRLGAAGTHGFCPFQKHRRKDKTFRVFRAGVSGDELYKCWSCDPPENMGDAIALYARFSGMDRKTAWRKLAEDGFDVPGAEEYAAKHGDRDRRAAPPKPVAPPPIRLRGTKGHDGILALEEAEWKRWRETDTGVVGRFAERRGLPVELLRRYGVVEMPGPGAGRVGFLYVDPKTNKPCRAKVKVMDPRPGDPPYYVKPRAPEGDPRTALGPLYLAHRLAPRGVASLETVLIVEGEVDALTCVHMGLPNVVSLPDGSESAKTVDLSPLFPRFNVWLVATDSDAPGDLSYKVLRDRGRAYGGTDVVRIRWRKLVDDVVCTYKDANDALVKGALDVDDFRRCLDVAMDERFNFTVPWGADAPRSPADPTTKDPPA